MAEEPSYQSEDMTDYPASGSVQEIDIYSLDVNYIATCVRFAQSHGIYPESYRHQHDNSFPYVNSDAIQEPFPQNHSTSFGHQTSDLGQSHGKYPEPCLRATSTGPFYAQSINSNHTEPLSALLDDDLFFKEAETHLREHLLNTSSSDSNTVGKGDTLSSTSPLSQPLEGANPMGQTLGRKGPHKHSPARGLAVFYNYDPLWVQNTGVDAQSVFEHRSKMNFEILFYEGVIQEGDYFVINKVILYTEGVRRDDVATLTFTGFSKTAISSKLQKRYPDLVLTLRDDPSYRHTIAACKGINTIVTALHDLNIDGPNIKAGAIAAELNVWRGDSNLGTFEYVKQAYHTWQNIRDAEHERTGTTWRARRNTKGKTVAMAERKPGWVKQRTSSGMEKRLKRFADGMPSMEV